MHIFQMRAYEKVALKYDGRKNLIEKIVTTYEKSGKNYDTRYRYQYNDKGYVVEIEIYDANDVVPLKLTFKYLEYDKAGNWIKQMTFDNDKPKNITERIIEYY